MKPYTVVIDADGETCIFHVQAANSVLAGIAGLDESSTDESELLCVFAGHHDDLHGAA